MLVDATSLLGMAFQNWEHECEAYVRELGATVWHMVPYKANLRTE